MLPMDLKEVRVMGRIHDLFIFGGQKAMLSEEVAVIRERFKRAGIELKDQLEELADLLSKEQGFVYFWPSKKTWCLSVYERRY